jgi:protein-S-isoprenylcysteine O-methyltransferase Ste14
MISALSIKVAALLIILWLLYFTIHSVLASLAFKRAVASYYPALMPWYRLLYNGLSLLLLIVPLLLLYLYPGEMLWSWQGSWAWLANGLALLAVAAFAWSLSFYDNGEFLGTRQLRSGRRSVEEQGGFHISPLHRYVRHPWYALGLIILWTRDMTVSLLVSVLLVTFYILVGAMLEERKLLFYHGERYRRYRQRVPALLPWPGRHLSRAEADEILQQDETD